jgi:hypothetical protein
MIIIKRAAEPVVVETDNDKFYNDRANDGSDLSINDAVTATDRNQNPKKSKKRSSSSKYKYKNEEYFQKVSLLHSLDWC